MTSFSSYLLSLGIRHVDVINTEIKKYNFALASSGIIFILN
jgi:hypothetical protein